MFSTQRNGRRIIVCEGTFPRNTYVVIFAGSYFECMRAKAAALLAAN